MPSSNPNGRESRTPSTTPPKAPGLEKRADQITQGIIDNLKRARREKAVLQSQPKPQ
jgi:hypothetical protein